jgi:hypothetical protein
VAYGLIALLVLGAWLLGRIDKDELSALAQQELPVVEVSQRFGAPCGGGILAEMRYSNS